MKKNSLIIDGNAVYEMDMDCLKKRRQPQRQQEKLQKPVDSSFGTIRVRNVDS
jgi:hypothetical protein